MTTNPFSSVPHNLRVAPGESAVFNPVIHGSFVILITNRVGITIKGSYLNNSSLLLSSKEILSSKLGDYLDSLIVPEVYTNEFILSPSVLVIGVSWPQSVIDSLIFVEESKFYIPWNVVNAVSVGEEILLSPDEMIKLITPLLGQCLGAKSEWLSTYITELPTRPKPLKVKDDGEFVRVSCGDSDNYRLDALADLTDPEATDLRNCLIKEFIDRVNALGHPLHGHLPTPNPIIDGFIVEIIHLLQNRVSEEQLEIIKTRIMDSPIYCHLVHLPEFSYDVVDALPYLINEETINTLLDRIPISLDESYLFSVTELMHIDINPLATTLELFDYYMGMPTFELDLQGCYATGDIIPVCAHVIPSEPPIDESYPPYYIDTSNVYFENIKDVIVKDPKTLLVTSSRNIARYSDTRAVAFPYRQTAHYETVESVDEVKVFPGSHLDILVDNDQDLGVIMQRILDVILNYYPDAFFEATEKGYIIKGAFRHVKLKHGTPLDILGDLTAMTRGWITGKQGNLDCILSASCVYSGINGETNNYYLPKDKYPVGTIAKFVFRGYNPPKGFGVHGEPEVQDFISEYKYDAGVQHQFRSIGEEYTARIAVGI